MEISDQERRVLAWLDGNRGAWADQPLDVVPSLIPVFEGLVQRGLIRKLYVIAPEAQVAVDKYWQNVTEQTKP